MIRYLNMKKIICLSSKRQENSKKKCSWSWKELEMMLSCFLGCSEPKLLRENNSSNKVRML